MLSIFQKYILPGLIVQSIVIGGGYGTGRELVEYFMTLGPLQGLFAMFIAMAVWSAVIAISFELARIGSAYDYKTFVKNLLGPGWVSFEITYFVGVILIVSVVGAASGELLHQMTGINVLLGTLLIMVVIAAIVYFGTPLLEKLFAAWSILIYAAYISLIVMAITQFGPQIGASFSGDEAPSGWLSNGIRYAAYNLGMIPAVLVFTRRLTNRRETLISGLLAGPIAMIPAVLLYFALLSGYPDILQTTIPTNHLLGTLNLPLFALGFQIILLGTIIDTGVGFIHGFNERIEATMAALGRHLSHTARAFIAAGLFIASVFVANAVGLVGLIAKGYGLYSIAVLVTFLLPVMTIGLWKVLRHRPANED